MPHVFLSSERQLRNGWWIAIFFLVLAALLLPLLLFARGNGSVPIGLQAAAVAIASVICQLLRRRPLEELVGRLDARWLRHLLLGIAGGALLMLLPAAFLGAIGQVSWQWSAAGVAELPAALLVYAGVAIAEELLFRGFFFQRLVDGLGPWPAQILVGGYFVLTHSAGLSTAGDLRIIASINIFLASILFGLAFLRTRSLAMPLGIHFAANVMQGAILGFGVSGSGSSGVIAPSFRAGPQWMSGGAFGLEASLPGLVCVVGGIAILLQWRGNSPSRENMAPVPARMERDPSEPR